MCEITIGFSKFCKKINSSNKSENIIDLTTGKIYPSASCPKGENYNSQNICTPCPSTCPMNCEVHSLRCIGISISFEFNQRDSTIERPDEARFRVYPFVNGNLFTDKLTFKYEDIFVLQFPKNRTKIIYSKLSYDNFGNLELYIPYDRLKSHQEVGSTQTWDVFVNFNPNTTLPVKHPTLLPEGILVGI